jgi:hypothetical protein
MSNFKEWYEQLEEAGHKDLVVEIYQVLLPMFQEAALEILNATQEHPLLIYTSMNALHSQIAKDHNTYFSGPGDDLYADKYASYFEQQKNPYHKFGWPLVNYLYKRLDSTRTDYRNLALYIFSEFGALSVAEVLAEYEKLESKKK